MRILTKSLLALAISLVISGSAGAAIDQSLPFVIVSVPKTPLHLGEVSGLGPNKVGGQVTAHVVANIPYHVSVSFDGLRQNGNGPAIPPKSLMAAVNGEKLPIGTGRVTVASKGPTPRGGVDIPIQLDVALQSPTSVLAGRYAGTLVITVIPGH